MPRAGSKEKAKKLIPGGVNSPVRAFQPYPFFTERAKGSRIFDVDGKVHRLTPSIFQNILILDYRQIHICSRFII